MTDVHPTLFELPKQEFPGSRSVAFREKTTKYFTGKPCVNGHISTRFTESGSCVECCRLRQAERWAEGLRPAKESRDKINKKWNASSKGHEAKKRWAAKDPMNAWVCFAVGGAKSRATKQNVPFNLTYEDVYTVAVKICPVFKCEMVYGSPKKPAWNSASLDKIVPSLGYVPGNIAIICHRANMVKSDASLEEIIMVADWIKSIK